MQTRFSFLAQQLSAFGQPVAVLDLEATGGHFANDRITEIAFLRFEHGRVSRFSRLINPQRHIPSYVSELTGISDAMTADCPTFAQILPQLQQELHGCLIIAHNSHFDRSLLANEYRRADMPFNLPALCSVRLSEALYPQEKRHSLDVLAERFGIPLPTDRHRAFSDVLLLAECLQAAMRLHPNWFDAAAALLDPPALPANLPPLLRASLLDLPEHSGAVVRRHHDGSLHIDACTHTYRETVSRLRDNTDIESIDSLPAAGPLHSLLLRANLMQQHGLSETTAPTGCYGLFFSVRQGCLKAAVRPIHSGFHPVAPYRSYRHGKAAHHALDLWLSQHRIRPNLLLHSTASRHEDECEQHNRTVLNAMGALRNGISYSGGLLDIGEHDPIGGLSARMLCRNGLLQTADGGWYAHRRLFTLLQKICKNSRADIRRLQPPPPQLHDFPVQD